MNGTITLNDGTVMPTFGLGTSKARDKHAYDATLYALSNGYTMIDTAQRYANESPIGRALKDSDLSRKDVFLVTKQWEFGAEEVTSDLQGSLERLQTDYVDLYLLHSPLGAGRIVETYDAMLQSKHNGLARSIGVSNFNVHHLEGLRKAGRPTPSVNQIELHPFQRKTSLVSYCQEHNITIMGYSPLAKSAFMTYRPLVDMAAKYKKTVAQLMIRWSVQKGYITIPKSKNPDRIMENTNVFDWRIDEADMELIEDFPEEKVAWETEDTQWRG